MSAQSYFDEFVVKIAARCNINCDYCYEYNLGDDSWRGASKFMSYDVAKALAGRVREHALAHQLERVCVSFHGGEPLLAGARRIDELASIFRSEVGGQFELFLSTQTNGLLLTGEICNILKKHEINVSVSLDGAETANNRHRVDFQGRSTYSRALRGIENAKLILGDQPSGLLAVIDIQNDPLEVFDSLAKFGIPHVDFLLPHHHWDRPPPRHFLGGNAYGSWLFAIFEAWVSGRHTWMNIRFFENIIRQLAGLPSNFEVMNLSPVRLVTVNTDGEIEAVDTLKSTSSGAQKTGLNVRENTFDDALLVHNIAIRQSGASQLSAKCTSCKFMRHCAGGYFPHRYSEKTGFNNPSVYCSDLYWLLENITSLIKGNRSIQD